MESSIWKSSQQSRGRHRFVPLHLSATDRYQHLFELAGCRRLFVLQLPDRGASHRGDQQTLGDFQAGFLQPRFQLLSVGSYQLKERFDSPAPVIPHGQRGRRNVGGNVAQQKPDSQQMPLRRALAAGTIQDDFRFRHPLPSFPPVIFRFSNVLERPGTRQTMRQVAQQNRFSLPTNPTVGIGAHQKRMALLRPFLIIRHAIRGKSHVREACVLDRI